jgi:hypothetical protein
MFVMLLSVLSTPGMLKSSLDSWFTLLFHVQIATGYVDFRSDDVQMFRREKINFRYGIVLGKCTTLGPKVVHFPVRNTN